NSLNENGVFIFDISSYYKISTILGNNTYAENYEDVSYIWENFFDEETNICDFDLTIFLRKGELFERFQENHKQRAYKNNEILNLLKYASFNKIEIFQDFTFNNVDNTAERINYICQK